MHSLADFNTYETKRRVNTPRSLEACYQQGILPEDLLYTQKDSLRKKHFQFSPKQFSAHEQNRLRMIQIASDTRDAIVKEGEIRKLKQKSPLTAPPFLEQLESSKKKQKFYLSKFASYERKLAEEESEKLTNLRAHSPKCFLGSTIQSTKSTKFIERHSEIKTQREINEFTLKTNSGSDDRIRRIQEKLFTEAAAKKKLLDQKLKRKKESAESIQATIESQKLKYYNARAQQRQDIFIKVHSTNELFRAQKSEKGLERIRNAQAKRHSIQEQDRYIKEQFTKKLKEDDRKMNALREHELKHWITLKADREKKYADVRQQRKQAIQEQLEEKRTGVGKKLHKMTQQIGHLRGKQKETCKEMKEEHRIKENTAKWQRQRQERIHNYNKSLQEAKIKDKQVKTEQFIQAKEEMMRERANLSIQSQLSKEIMKSTLFEMAVTKHWDPARFSSPLSDR